MGEGRILPEDLLAGWKVLTSPEGCLHTRLPFQTASTTQASTGCLQEAAREGGRTGWGMSVVPKASAPSSCPQLRDSHRVGPAAPASQGSAQMQHSQRRSTVLPQLPGGACEPAGALDQTRQGRACSCSQAVRLVPSQTLPRDVTGFSASEDLCFLPLLSSSLPVLTVKYSRKCPSLACARGRPQTIFIKFFKGLQSIGCNKELCSVVLQCNSYCFL